jgi:hypothetical protein
MPDPFTLIRDYPLLDAILHRRSRRFGAGFTIPTGPFQYHSAADPVPLSPLEEAILCFTGAGVTGLNLLDWQYEGVTGNTMINFTGHTFPSACAAYGTELFYTNDGGVWLFRMNDITAEELQPVAPDNVETYILDMFQRHRVRIQDHRLDIFRGLPAMLPFNTWDTNQPGSTYFIPITNITLEYINFLFSMLDEQWGFYIVDDHFTNQPCGLAKHARSNGGYLRDDLPDRILPLTGYEIFISTNILMETPIALHNIMLMEQAMGLGGWTHNCGGYPYWYGLDPGLCKGFGFQFAHETRWWEKLGGFIGGVTGGPAMVSRKNPVALGDHLKAYCPPNYKNMEQAVMAVYNRKFGPHGEYAKQPPQIPWKDRTEISKVKPPSDRVVRAVIDFCNYVYEQYGRFPALVDAFATQLVHQSHHLDLAFYDKFYRPGAYTDAHKNHMQRWH